ncbi:MAG: DEAD/DEAH box helicase [Isosphaeraceae bacterium]
MELRDYQARSIDGIYRYFEFKRGNPLVVVPTGGGKSVIIGAFCRQVLEQWPNQRIIVLSHVKELLEQNFDKIIKFWPEAPAGLYSAGLRSRQSQAPIVVASIQSAYRKPHIFGWRDLVLIDECHLLSPDSDTMYRRFLDGLKETNRLLKVVGFTATPYRLRTGMLTEGKGRLFDEIACEISMAELLEAGHISRMVGKASATQADLAGVELVAGDFNRQQMETSFDKEALTAAALDEVFALAEARRSWLFFCSGVGHAHHVRDALLARGVGAATVTGETPTEERDAILRAFKAGELRAVTNANVLTTGFDAPNIDLIAMLRSTTSPGLFLQMAGRGLRLAPGKRDCLMLDYGGNLERHGCLDQIKPPRTANKRPSGDRHTPTCLICPDCRMANPLGARECGECARSFERPERFRHDTRASEAAVMASESTRPADDLGEWVEVDLVRYERHEKEGGHPSMRVEYVCGVTTYKEWVCLEHPPGYAKAKAISWWKRRYSGPMIPDEIWKALYLSHLLRKPTRVRVKMENKFWRVTGYDFKPIERQIADAREGGPLQEAGVAPQSGEPIDFG